MALTECDVLAERAMQAILTGEVMRADPLTSLSTILTEQKMLRIANLAYDMADPMVEARATESQRTEQ